VWPWLHGCVSCWHRGAAGELGANVSCYLRLMNGSSRAICFCITTWNHFGERQYSLMEENWRRNER
jgi:hypothetical protein